jgi:GMP synthase (glutamine-hydrolysing)
LTINKKVLIIDFGSQVTQLIARRVREFEIFCEIINPSTNINLENVGAIILSGGPASVNEVNKISIDQKIFSSAIPILGICYGQQLLCSSLGGEVKSSQNREFGKSIINIKDNSSLFKNFKTDKSQVWMSHGDVVTKIPKNFKVLADTKDCPFAAIAHEEKKIFAVQFHPEVIHSVEGKQLIKNFLFKISSLQPNWTMKNFKEEEIKKIKKTVGNNNVICGLSGGVDSSVVAALINKSIGSQLTCIFVDNGFLRLNEGKIVKDIFEKNFKIKLVYVDAKKIFLEKIKNTSDPEQKRKIIGATFIEIFDKEASKIKNAKFLAQGTLYPDVIESSHPNKGSSQTIKSHHNTGGLPKNIKFKLIEPLRMLFKDEARELGKELGLPQQIINRHPFPGPGLAIRIIGNITEDKIKILQKADAIYLDEIKKAGLYNKIWQAFSVLTNVKTVGVMGDKRTYEYVLSLRAVTSVDGMTADIFKFDVDFLAFVSNRIIAEVQGINRVVYDCTSKPPGTIEWE